MDKLFKLNGQVMSLDDVIEQVNEDAYDAGVSGLSKNEIQSIQTLNVGSEIAHNRFGVIVRVR